MSAKRHSPHYCADRYSGVAAQSGFTPSLGFAAQNITARGFTLIEVLVAVAITAVISLGVFQVMTTVIDSKAAIDDKSRLFADLQRLDFIFKRDVTQMIAREVIDESTQRLQSVILDDEGSDYLLEFSRLGWQVSPVSEHRRSAIQRVAYHFEDFNASECKEARERVMLGREDEKAPDGYCLIRYYWLVLDRVSDTEPLQQVLYDFVGPDSEISMVVELRSAKPGAEGLAESDAKAQEIRTVETTSDVRLNADKTAYVKALNVKLDIPGFGLFERYWATPKVKITNADIYL